MRFDSPAIHATAPKATRIDLFSFSTPQMRAFHVTWLAFFVCFFAWFAAAPLMPLIKAEFALTKDQIANINIAAVAVTILVRVINRTLVRQVRTAPHLHLASTDRCQSGLRAGVFTQLFSFSIFSALHRRVVCHHAISYQRDVRVQCGRHCECDRWRLGERRRRLCSKHHAAHRRRSRGSRRRTSLWLACRHVRARGVHAHHGFRLRTLYAGHPSG